VNDVLNRDVKCSNVGETDDEDLGKTKTFFPSANKGYKTLTNYKVRKT
jgi:hypothetical protein